MRLSHDGVEFEMLTEDDLTWVEADAVERVVGKTMVQIGAAAQVCGCEHRLSDHVPVDPEDENDLKCNVCGCDTPMPNTPANVARAMLWVSMKRASPELSFAQVGDFGMGSFEQVKSEPDPTEPVDSTGDEPSS